MKYTRKELAAEFEKYTDEELYKLCKESSATEEKLVRQYRDEHKIPSRGIISTPEIDAAREMHTKVNMERLRRAELKRGDNQ